MATNTTTTRTTRAAAKAAPAKKAAATKKAAPAKKAPASAQAAAPSAAPANAGGRRLPKVQIPKVQIPKVRLPKLELPTIDLPEITVPAQLTTAQQHVVSAAKQAMARVNDRIDPARRRTVVLERVDRAERGTLQALESAMSRTAAVRSRLELPFSNDLGKAVRRNVEFAVKLTKRQADFAERVVKTLVPAA